MIRLILTTAATAALILNVGIASADEPAPAADSKVDANAKSEKKAEPPTTTLHVASPIVVPVERVDTGEVVCNSPCDVKVPTGVRYRIGGSHPSDPFVLAPPAEGVDNVEVRPGMRGWFWGGVAGLGIGAGLIGVGIYVLAHGYANQDPVGGAESETPTTFTDAMSLGTGLILGGVVASIWGGATMISYGSTKLRGNIRGADAPSHGTAQLNAPVLSVPVLTGTF